MPLTPAEYRLRKATIDRDWPPSAYPGMNAVLTSELSDENAPPAPRPTLPAAPVRTTQPAPARESTSSIDLNAERAKLALAGIMGQEADRRLRIAEALAKGEQPDDADYTLAEYRSVVEQRKAAEAAEKQAEKDARNAAQLAEMAAEAEQTEAEVEAAGGWEQWGQERRAQRRFDAIEAAETAKALAASKALNPHLPDEMHKRYAEQSGKAARQQAEQPGVPSEADELRARLKTFSREDMGL